MKLYRRGKQGFFDGYFRYNGKRVRISTGTANERAANKILEKHFKAMVKCDASPTEHRIKFEALCELMVLDYEKHRRHSLVALKGRIKILKRFFGLDKAVDITSERLDRMMIDLRKEGYSDQTINHCLNAVNRMFVLARRRTPPLLSYAPYVSKIRGIKNVRKGFFEQAEIDAVIANLKPAYAVFVQYLYVTANRRGEAAKIERRQVVWRDQAQTVGVIVLEDSQTKNGTPRTIPLAGRIADVVRRALTMTDLRTPLLFHDDGHAIHSGGSSPFYKAWLNAREAAGLEGRRVHDLRRTGVRNLRRATKDPFLSKEISGHKTMSVYERYDIKDDSDLIAAAERLTEYLDAQPKQAKVVNIAARKSKAAR